MEDGAAGHNSGPRTRQDSSQVQIADCAVPQAKVQPVRMSRNRTRIETFISDGKITLILRGFRLDAGQIDR